MYREGLWHGLWVLACCERLRSDLLNQKKSFCLVRRHSPSVCGLRLPSRSSYSNDLISVHFGVLGGFAIGRAGYVPREGLGRASGPLLCERLHRSYTGMPNDSNDRSFKPRKLWECPRTSNRRPRFEFEWSFKPPTS